jgi:uncharacterized protein (UPF0548 family)
MNTDHPRFALSLIAAALAAAPSPGHELPLGDGRASNVPRAGYVMTCQAFFAGAPGAFRSGDWIANGRWDPARKPVVEGDVLAIAARCGGLWWSNAARVVYVVDEQVAAGRRRGFAYGTLADHVERGEERFVVEQLPDGSVWYDLAAFSRPRHPLVWLSYPLARRMQERFRRASAEALQAAVADVGSRKRRG